MSSSYRRPEGRTVPLLAVRGQPDRTVGASLAAARTAFVVGAALGVAQGAHAAGWDYSPRIEIGGMYNDNYRLAQSSVDKIHVSGALLDAQFGMRLLTPTSELSMVPKIVSSYFPNDTADQSTNGYFILGADHKTLKGNYGIAGQYANESVIFSELLPADFPGVGLGQVVGENGRVSVRNRRTLERLAPSMTYDLTPRRHLHLDAEYLHASFSHNLIQQIGFNNVSAKAGMGFDVSKTSTFTANLLGARFEPNGSFGKTNSFGFDAQWDLRRTDIMRYYFRLGAVNSRSDVSFGTKTSTGVVGGTGVSWTYQVTQYVFDAVRAVTPTSTGSVENHNEVRFRVVRAFRPLLQGFVGVRAVVMRGAVGQGLDVQGSDYLAGTAGFYYQLTQKYRLAGEYDYTYQKFEREPNAASNSVGLSIIYQPWSKYEPLPDLNGLPVGLPQ